VGPTSHRRRGGRTKSLLSPDLARSRSERDVRLSISLSHQRAIPLWEVLDPIVLVSFGFDLTQYNIPLTMSSKSVNLHSVFLYFIVFGCTSPDQVKVTWTHWGMTCGGFKTAVSGPVVLLAAMFSLLFKYL
jgi:hypothetical protein